MAERGMRSGYALSGIRVLDMGRFIAAPFCTSLLRLLGADVIKVERLTGDDARNVEPFVNGQSLYFTTYNRGKRSFAVDLRNEVGQQLVKRLVAASDVVVENFRPGTMAKMGLGYDAIASFAPQVVLTSVSGFGQYGPYKDRPAFDAIAQAMSGLMQLTGDNDDPPLLAGTFVADYIAGLYSAFGTVVALLERAVSGQGQHVDVSLFDGIVSALGPGLTDFLTTGRTQPRTGNRDRITAPANCYRSRDGWVYLHAGTDPLFARLSAAMERPDLLTDMRFAGQAERMRHQGEIDRVVEEWTSEHTAAQLEEVGLTFGFPCARVSGFRDLVTNPQLEARRIWAEADEPGIGRVTTIGSVVQLSRSLARAGESAPELGQHTREIARELLEIDDRECDALAEAKVIREPAPTRELPGPL